MITRSKTSKYREIPGVSFDRRRVVNLPLPENQQSLIPSTRNLTEGIRFNFENNFDSIEVKNKDILKKPKKIKDYRLKNQKKFFRPYFSPFFDSYEMDYASSGRYENNDKIKVQQNYLFVININTKFLIVEPLPLGKSPSIDETINALENVFNKLELLFNSNIHNLRFDADIAFGRKMLDLLKSKGVKNIFRTNSKLINRNRCVDRVIRTIRDLIGQKTVRFFNTQYMQYIVNIYNNSPHAAYNFQFSPLEVQMNPEIEGAYIRHQINVLKNVKQLQREAKFYEYKPGNILMVHIPKNKTSALFDKRRRVFSDLAIFKEYNHGNVICSLLNMTIFKKSDIELPIFYTRYVCENLNELPKPYVQQFEVRASYTIDDDDD